MHTSANNPAIGQPAKQIASAILL